MARRILLLSVMACVTASCANASASLTSDQRQELDTLSGQLADPSRSALTKRDAAVLLLGRSYKEATDALIGFLESRDNHQAQIAIAEAIASRPDRNKAYIKPLQSLLVGDEPSVRPSAAKALASYKNHGVARDLMSLVRDTRQDRGVRLVIIGALQHMLDKSAVDTLITLLDDSDAGIRDASVTALARLTNIPIGNDPAQWKQWWRRNKDKPSSVWLADLADSLAKAKTSLEGENASLRERLVKTIEDLYAATPPQRRNAMLLNCVKDSLVEVRLAGLTLIGHQIAASATVSPELALKVREMLADEDPRVRASSALLVAHVAEADAIDLLLVRLDSEKMPSVRQNLLTALGQLRNAKALPAVLKEIGSQSIDVTAAVTALARIASEKPLGDDQREKANMVLIDRYRRNGHTAENAPQREAIVTAMGVLGGDAVAPVLIEALKDPAATVRLAAVNGMVRLDKVSFASSLVAMVADEDRGVRQAAIVGLGKLNGSENLQTILGRTLPEAESDAGVRKRAWDVAMSILARADAVVLVKISESLAERTDDVTEQRIKVGQMLVNALKADKSPVLAEARRELAGLLIDASRPAEAAAQLAEAVALLQAVGSDQVSEVWMEWIDALLKNSAPVVVKVIAENPDKKSFDEAVMRLETALGQMHEDGKFAQASTIAAEALAKFAPRLSDERKTALEKLLAGAREKQIAADRERVSVLVRQLTGADADATKAAEVELKTLAERAVRPLVEELKTAVSAAEEDSKAETAILGILTQVAPKLSGYTPGADKADRLKAIESWLTSLEPETPATNPAPA